jgi:hypothetical protein
MLPLFAGAGNESLDVLWSRGAPSLALHSSYWPEMGAAACDTCPNGALMLDKSGALGIKLSGAGPSVGAAICWYGSTCIALYQDGTSLATSSGSILCASGGSAILASECGVGEEELHLESNGALQAATLGCVGMTGGGASASGVYTAALSISVSHCVGAGADETSWQLWIHEYTPPDVTFQVRTGPSVATSGNDKRWSFTLKSGVSEIFRGGFGNGGAGLRATNTDTGATVDFPASAYVQHAAWSGSSLVMVISTAAEYDSIGGAALEAEWAAAFPGPSNSNPISLSFGPSPTHIDMCDPSSNPMYTGYETSGSTFCYASADVDEGNELIISLAGGAAELVIDSTNASFVPRATVNGAATASSLAITATASGGATYTLNPTATASQGSHRVRTARRGLTLAHLLLQDVQWEPDAGGAATADGAYVEVTAWSDCLALSVQSVRSEGALGGSLSLAAVELRWTLGLDEHVSPATPAPDGSVALRVCVDGGRLVAADTEAASAPDNAIVAATYLGAGLTTEWRATTGESVVLMPSNLPKCSYSSGCADVHEITVSVTADAGARLRLVLARNFHRERNALGNQAGSEITGEHSA